MHDFNWDSGIAISDGVERRFIVFCRSHGKYEATDGPHNLPQAVQEAMHEAEEVTQAQHRSRCVVCDKPMNAEAAHCGQCLQPCALVLYDAHGRVVETHEDGQTVDAKSACCHADLKQLPRITCSEPCHEAWMKRLEEKFGTHKIIVSAVTGKQHRVPLRVLIEDGVRGDELDKFPIVE